MNDEREGLPSCSSLERLAKCAGSWHWSRRVPPAPSSDDADSGTRIHAVLAREAHRSTLSEEECHIADRCDSILGDLLRSRGIPQDHPVSLEKRYWMLRDDGTKLISGKADVALVHRPGKTRVGLIADYKTGRNEVPAARDNLQLMGLAACMAEECMLPEVTVAIIHPWGERELTVAEYQPDELEAASLHVRSIVAAALSDEGRTTTAGDWCKYCPAKGLCPATRQAVETMAVTVTPDRELMSPEDKLAFWRACCRATEIAESFKAYVKRCLESDPNSIPGLTLKPGAVRSKVTDVATLYSRINQRFNTNGTAFAAACSITKTNLKTLLKAETGKKGGELDALVKELTDGIVEESQSAPSVEEVAE